MAWIEPVAAVFGLICVWLTVRQNIWCWPTGLVQVVLYLYVFYSVRLYSDLILHGVYVVLSLYGWYHWLHGGQARDTLPVTRLAASRLTGWILAGMGGTAILGYIMSSYTDAAAPYPDAFTTAMSLIAQWLMARKKLESWGFWIAVDVVAIAVYLYKDLYYTSALYAVFLLLAIAGFAAWRRAANDSAQQ